MSTTIEMEPLISIQLFGHQPAYQPGDLLKCDYQIDAVDQDEVQAVEASGLVVHRGQRGRRHGRALLRPAVGGRRGRSRPPRAASFQYATSPDSPLSYKGQIMQVLWCVRVALLRRGQDTWLDHRFQLGFVLRLVKAT